MNTELMYMKVMQRLNCEAEILDVEENEGVTAIILDQTIFYPQGGGQPYDKGIIRSSSAIFKVDEVRFVEGVVRHIGRFEKGEFNLGEKVTCEVDGSRRSFMSRLHSAGHVVDMAVHSLGLHWTPGKGFHFPDGPYVEYSGELEENVESLRQQIENNANRFTEEGIDTRIEFMPKEAMAKVCRYVPDYLPEGKPARVVFYGDYGVPCGGTHVANLADIKSLQIRKIKLEKSNIRVSYSIE